MDLSIGCFRPIAIARNTDSTIESSIRVLVVEDHEPFRQFACSTLRKKAEFDVVCEVSDGLETVRMAEKLQPDLILLDVGLPSLNGIEAARRIHKLVPKSKIVFLSQESPPVVVHAALSVGAQGYVVKTQAESELLSAVGAAIRGKQFDSAVLGVQATTGPTEDQARERHRLRKDFPNMPEATD